VQGWGRGRYDLEGVKYCFFFERRVELIDHTEVIVSSIIGCAVQVPPVHDHPIPRVVAVEQSIGEREKPI